MSRRNNRQKKKNYGLIGAIIGAVIVIIGGGLYYTQSIQPHNQAVSKFESAQKEVEAENKQLANAISSAKAVLDSKETVYDINVVTQLQAAITGAKEVKRVIPTLPKKTKEITEAANKLKEPLDYSTEIASLKEKQVAVENSIKQYQQVSNPAEDFVIARLKEVPSIVDIQAVTEDNDPNGNLNKQGGYTAAVYFLSSEVDQSDVYGDSLTDKGTDAGGCIEVYGTMEEAQARNIYLAGFDTGALNSGSHNVVGTIVVRTSSKLAASQQASLEAEIIAKLIALQ